MNTFSFIKRIGNIFKANIEEAQVVNPAMPVSGVQPASLPQVSVPDNSSVNNLELAPVVTVVPSGQPVTMATYEYKNFPGTNDLATMAMDECIKVGGSITGLQRVVEVVVMNYKMEAQAKEEETKAVLSRRITELNNETIRLNNDIANIREFLIPGKEKDMQEFKSEMRNLVNNEDYDLQTDLGSELHTILAVSLARTREHVRNLQARIIDFKTVIEQKKNDIDTLNLQMEHINLFTEDALARRLSIFFKGWLASLEGIGASEKVKEDTRQFIDWFMKSEVSEYFNN